ncbi:unnamed protein product, partial [Amoebophrya sp. A120]
WVLLGDGDSADQQGGGPEIFNIASHPASRSSSAVFTTSNAASSRASSAGARSRGGAGGEEQQQEVGGVLAGDRSTAVQLEDVVHASSSQHDSSSSSEENDGEQATFGQDQQGTVHLPEVLEESDLLRLSNEDAEQLCSAVLSAFGSSAARGGGDGSNPAGAPGNYGALVAEQHGDDGTAIAQQHDVFGGMQVDTTSSESLSAGSGSSGSEVQSLQLPSNASRSSLASSGGSEGEDVGEEHQAASGMNQTTGGRAPQDHHSGEVEDVVSAVSNSSTSGGVGGQRSVRKHHLKKTSSNKKTSNADHKTTFAQPLKSPMSNATTAVPSTPMGFFMDMWNNSPLSQVGSPFGATRKNTPVGKETLGTTTTENKFLVGEEAQMNKEHRLKALAAFCRTREEPASRGEGATGTSSGGVGGKSSAAAARSGSSSTRRHEDEDRHEHLEVVSPWDEVEGIGKDNKAARKLHRQRQRAAGPASLFYRAARRTGLQLGTGPGVTDSSDGTSSSSEDTISDSETEQSRKMIAAYEGRDEEEVFPPPDGARNKRNYAAITSAASIAKTQHDKAAAT